MDNEKESNALVLERLGRARLQAFTPEAIVNDAWRAMLIGNLMIAVGDRPHYSAGNAYANSTKASAATRCVR